MAQLDNYNQNPFIITQTKPDEIGFLEGFGIGASEAVDDLSFNLIGNIFNNYDAQPNITEDEWRNSPYWRQSLKYHPRLTWDWAQNLAETHDDNAESARLNERMTTLGTVGSFGGAMATGLLDPVNWLALPAGVTAALVRTTGSKLLAGATYGALTNVAAEAALAPLRSASADIMQEKYGISEFATDAAVSGGLGFLFGGAGNVLGRALRRRRQTTDVETVVEQTATDAPLVDAPQTDAARADAATIETPSVTEAVDAQTAQPQQPTPQQPEPQRFNIEQDDASLAAEINKSIKGATDDLSKKQVLFELAKVLPRERFIALSKLVRNKRKDRKIASKWFRQLFDDIAGVSKANNLLNLDTKVGAIWDKANNETAIIDANVLLDTVDSEYVRVLETRDLAPDDIGEDRFVIFEAAPSANDPNFEGTALGLARAKSEIEETLGRNTFIDEVTFRVSDTGETVTLPRDQLDDFFDELASNTGLQRLNAVIDGADVDEVVIPEKLKQDHFETLEQSWGEIKQLYGSQTLDDITDAADELVATVTSPEDMQDMINNLRTQITPDDTTLAAMLDEAEATSGDFAAQREALKAAYTCLLGQ